ncbi:thioesterase family protein [Psychrobacter sp. 16-MNA-CIBAN-0192]|uniref:thioesterase family protein n=1 Tax=Psychrobacter sp. 16-MNA-CIBAN-0192 TaxID=3140448 RepID=UPI00332F9E6C
MSDRELNTKLTVFTFETLMRVRSAEVEGGYLTLEALVVLLKEVRARFLYAKGIPNINTDHQGLIVNHLQLSVLSRVQVREALLFEVGVEQLSDKEAMIAIKVSRMHDGSRVAIAREHIVNYDYRLNKVTTITIDMQEKLSPASFGI